jgi:hypothetical protein
MEGAMHHKILLRWIAEAEARWVRSVALLIREASEPHACIVAVAVPSRLVRLCRRAARRGRRQASSPLARLTSDE